MDRTGIIKRYKELEEELTPHLIFATGSALLTEGGKTPEPAILRDILWNWTIKALNIVARTCNENSQHFKKLEEITKNIGTELTAQSILKMLAIFRAAKDDFEKGYIFDLKQIAQAEIFDDELDQSEELHKHGFLAPAAVVAGTVLESKLRFLCEKNNLPTGKLDKMNSDLAKANIYNKNTQKRITAIAGVRNSAAHGNKDEFDDSDVETMIKEVRIFVSKHDI